MTVGSQIHEQNGHSVLSNAHTYNALRWVYRYVYIRVCLFNNAARVLVRRAFAHSTIPHTYNAYVLNVCKYIIACLSTLTFMRRILHSFTSH